MEAICQSDAVDISVVVCTYNRADMLEDTLKSWRAIDAGDCRAELIVVDNNSTDRTRRVFEDVEKVCAGECRYAFEASPGLSFARNKGIAAARGGIIAFVDDDIYFEKNWLKKMALAFRSHPEADCVGGNSIPIFESPRPSWLTDDLLLAYGSTLSGDREKMMAFPEHPFGVNMAFRREVFARVGPFNTRLGRIKKSLLSNEEKELFYRIDQAGMQTLYTPDAVVYHRIPKDRIDQQWLLKRVYWQGISKVAFNQLIHRRSRLALLEDALRHGKRALLGPRPLSAKNSILFCGRHDFKEKMKTALSLGIARQSLAEFMHPHPCAR